VGGRRTSDPVCFAEQFWSLSPDQYAVYAQQILEVNTQVQAALDKGVRLEGGSGLMELWDFLQLKCASYINSDLPGLGQAHMQPPGKPLRCAMPYHAAQSCAPAIVLHDCRRTIMWIVLFWRHLFCSLGARGWQE